ncbi:family 78 glycoside hydrolase catalytic domain [Victivallis lenta]|nr:family 78 glycoside hydrolase catalytic domain [Victivallis lenta]
MKTILPNAERPPASHSIAEAAPLIIEKEKLPFFAAWITHPEVAKRWQKEQTCEENFFCEFYREFNCDQLPESILLRITADSCYRLSINGKEAGFGPIRGSAALQYFDTREIAGLLRRGRNEIKVLVHSPVRENFTAVTRFPALLAEAPGLFRTDETWQVSLCPEFRRDVPVYTMQIGFMEMCDLRKRREREYLPAAALPEPLPFGALTPRDIPAPEITECRPEKLTAMAALPAGDAPELSRLAEFLNHEQWTALNPEDFNGKILPSGNSTALVWDFGKVLNGRIQLEVNAPAGTVVDVVYGETPYRKDGRLRAAFPGEFYRFTDRYILDAGCNRIGTTLFERGFKFAEFIFRNAVDTIEVVDVRAENRVYPFRQKCFFRCSDERLNCIYQQCVETLRACTTDVFTDCPWRERAFWINDLLVENRTSLVLFGATPVHARALRLAFSQQRPDGSVPSLCPMPKHENFVFPATELFLVLMLMDYYRYGGDPETVGELLPKAERLLEHFNTLLDDEGLIGITPGIWNFIDWSFELNGYSFNDCRESMVNSLYVLALRTIVALAKQSGCRLKRNPEFYLVQSERTAEAIAGRFYSSGKGFLTDDVLFHSEKKQLSSLIAQALALLAGIGDATVREKLKISLADESLLKPELYLYSFVLQAMARHGMIREALAVIRRYWGKILDSGYPTVFEAGVHQFGKDAFGGAGSMCHGFATAPAAFLPENILGLTPGVEGNGKKFAFHPAPGDLEWAEGELLLSENTSVQVRLTREEIRLTLPEEHSAELPDGRILEAGTHLLKWENINGGLIS